MVVKSECYTRRRALECFSWSMKAATRCRVAEGKMERGGGAKWRKERLWVGRPICLAGGRRSDYVSVTFVHKWPLRGTNIQFFNSTALENSCKWLRLYAMKKKQNVNLWVLWQEPLRESQLCLVLDNAGCLLSFFLPIHNLDPRVPICVCVKTQLWPSQTIWSMVTQVSRSSQSRFVAFLPTSH